MAKPRINGISRARLHEVMGYEPETGVFRWRIRPVRSSIEIGTIAGSAYPNGYRYITIDGDPYRCCRLAWLHFHGDPIPDEIDHHNTIKSDDRIDNLRPVTTSRNQANRGIMSTNTSGIKGVRYDASRCKWVAHITVEGVAKNLGRYLTKEEAARAYEHAARAAFGEFARIK